MLKTIKIDNFRSFKSFELQQLGRVNLLVGKNNSGKTSILEAIQLLCSRTNLEPLAEVMINRGEYFLNDHQRRNSELDICHLFYGHEIQPDSNLCVSGMNDENKETITVSIGARYFHIDDDLGKLGKQLNEESSILNESSLSIKGLNLGIKWTHGEKTEILTFPLSNNNSLNLDYIQPFHRDGKNPAPKIQFITSSSLETEKMIELFEQIVLTPEEKLVEQALHRIDSKIQRIAPVSSRKSRYSLDSRGGFFVLLSDSNQRVPIGSMGDGIWRILGLALATVCAKDGYLFVDEIDTGLHFTAMSDMWKLIWETAKRLNVQVFATTHNSDCWTSLASIAEQEDVTEDGIRIHRIEKGKETSVVFTEPQIVIAAEREIEVR
ncbi:ATP/GTP-binding protein [Nostoc sp. C117]|uniref:AAA family ATPase n=1 Tax=Nostoc sp. C117 TaxID=3349875 RepID=UPI00370D2B33